VEELLRVPEVSFLRPERALFVLAAVALVLLVRRGARPLAAALRAVACAALLALLLEPVVPERTMREGAVLALVDVSPSMGEEGLALAGAWLSRAPARFALATFGAAPGPVVEAGGDVPRLCHDEQMATDLAAALRLAAAWAGPERPRRVVLLTDGRATEPGAEEEAARLRGAGIELFAAGFPPPSPASASGAVSLARLVLPAPEEARAEFSVVAEAQTDAPARATAKLYVDGVPVQTREVELAAGTSSIAFEPIALPPGVHFVQALAGRSVASGVVRVPGTPRVLLLAARERRALLADALGAQGFDARVAAAGAKPALAGHDAVVILPDAPAPDVEALHEALATFVGRDGGGLLAVGGAEGDGLARLRGTPIAFLLPLDIEPRARPAPRPVEAPEEVPKVEVVEERTEAFPITLCILLDRSGSMAGDKLERAKQAAAAAAAALKREDRIAVIAFGDAPETVVTPRPAGDSAAVLRALGPLRAEGNTAMFAALVAGYALLDRETSPIRHLVLISDGKPTDDGRWRDLITAMADRKITLSTVGIGFDIDPQRLSRFVEWGGGRFWSANHPHEVPQIVTLDALRVVEARGRRGEDAERRAPAPPRPPPPSPAPPAPAPPREAAPLEADPAVPRDALRGLADERLPSVVAPERGTPRFAAWVAARAKGVPVLAYWRFGLGTVAALTVDPEAPFERALREHEEFPRIAAQLLRSLLPDAPREALELSGEVRGEDGRDRFVLRAVAEDGQPRTDLDVSLEALDSGEGGGELPVVRRARAYEAWLPPATSGPARLRVRAGGVERVFVVPRSAPRETKDRGADRDALLRLVGDPARLDPSPESALRAPVEEVPGSRPLPLPFLLLAAILLPLDAWARRSSASR
jgi:Ca-activated chloride channel family protein